MTNKFLEILLLLCYVNLFALTLSQEEGASDESDWIIFIKRANKKTCAGVQLSNEWILTLGDCIEQGALHKYKVVTQYKPKTRSVREERRSPGGGFLVLLRVKVSSTPETETKYSGLAKSTVFDNFEQFHTYRYNDKEVFEAISIEFVKKQRCLRTDVAGKFGKGQHTCYRFKSGDSDICLPGLPAFGSVRRKLVLQGLSNTSADACDTVFQATAAVAPVRGWLLQQLKDCGYPKVKNGEATLDEPFFTTFGATASVSCKKGYQSGQDTLTCQDSGEWEKTKCILRDCGPAPILKNGEVVLDVPDTSTVGATASVTCGEQFTTETKSIACKANGQWEKPKCRLIDCGSLPSVAYGDVNLDSKKTVIYSTATVSCDLGFLANSSSIICQDSGMWEVPVCTALKDCGSVSEIKNGFVVLRDSKDTFVGSIADVYCDVGYTPSRSEVVCKETGTWEEQACIIKDCGSPPSFPGGSVSLDSTTTTFNSTATVICNEGFYANQSYIVCDKKGRWEVPKCKIKDCGPPPTIRNGSVDLDSTTTEFNSTASVTCDIGHETNQTSISCIESGRWEVPTCTIKNCGFLPSVSDGSLDLDSTTTVYGSTATLSCNNGFYTNQTSIVCQESGRWEVSTCTLKDCGSLPSISDGEISLDATTTTFGSTATVNCDKGYETDSSQITCQGTGLWEVPTCIIVDCGLLPSLDNGLLTLSDGTTYGSTASVTCNSGYSYDKETIKCTSSGSWTVATCTIKDCGSLPSLSDGTLALDSSTTTFGSTASVTCSTGYSANKNKITCKATGSWDTPTCTINDCGALASLADGSLTLDSSTTTYGSTASATCDAGYDASKSSINCLETGTWQTTKCKIRDCGSKPTVKNASTKLDSSTTTVGSTVTVKCKSGYSTKKTTLVCKTNGSWAVTTCSKN